MLFRSFATVGANVFIQDEVTITEKYNGKTTFVSLEADFEKFINLKTKKFGINSNTLNEKLYKISDSDEIGRASCRERV